MQQIFIELSKYIFAFLIAFYTLASYQGAVMQNEQKRRKIYFTQNVLMFIIHLLGYLILYILNAVFCAVYLSVCCGDDIRCAVSEGIQTAGE